MPSGIDCAVLLYALGLSLATGVVFGLYPGAAQHAARSASSCSRATPASRRARAPPSRFRVGLATSQIALSMALLVAAGLFTKSLYNVSRVDLGLQTDTARHLRRVAGR